jgi:RNA polymerase sigma-70 factor, ECF subfamily
MIQAVRQDDERLMLEVKAGSRRAFDALFTRHRDAVWRFFRRRVPDAARAEELAQDTFLGIFEAAARYEPSAAFRSYLFGVAYNVLLADRRRTRNLHAPLADGADIEGPSSDLDAAMWVRDGLATLDDDDREILMLREYEQLSYQEIADLRLMPLNTVRSRLFRARMALRAALQNEVRTTDDRR